MYEWFERSLVPLPSLDERKEIIEIFASDTLVFSDDYSLDDLALRTVL